MLFQMHLCFLSLRAGVRLVTLALAVWRWRTFVHFWGARSMISYQWFVPCDWFRGCKHLHEMGYQ